MPVVSKAELAEIIEKAKDTSDWLAVKDLAFSISEENLSFAAVDAILQNLDASLIPVITEKCKLSVIQLRALSSAFGLPRVVRAATSPGLTDRYRMAVAERVIKSFEDIIAWLHHHIDYGLAVPLDKTIERYSTACVLNAKLLCELLSLSFPVLDTVVASTAGSNFVIKVWLSQTAAQTHHHMATAGEECPINLMLLRCLSASIASKRMLGQKIRFYAREQKAPEKFLDAVIQRGWVLRRLVRIRKITPEDATVHYRDLASITGYLMSDPLFQEVSEIKDIWSNMAQVVEDIAERASTMDVLVCIGCLFFAAIEYSSRRARNVHRILYDTNLMRVFLRFATRSPLSSDETKLTIHVIERIDTMCHFPEGPDWLAHKFATSWEADANYSKMVNHPQKEIRDRWGFMRSQLESSTKLLTKLRGPESTRRPPRHKRPKSNRGSTAVHICDNQACYSNWTEKSKNSRACKGCHTVIYCSENCQREDWECRHRKECRPALVEYQRQVFEGSWYAHRIRAYHLAFIEDYYCTELDGTMFARHPTLRVNFLKGHPLVATPHPQDYQMFRNKVTTSSHNADRFKDLWTQMEQEQKKGTKAHLGNGEFVIFIETLYCWDNHGGILSLLIKLKGLRVPGAERLLLRAVYSVTSLYYCVD